MRFANSTRPFAIAACAVALPDGQAATEIQLTPAGEFRGWDGRPKDAPRWYIDAALAAQVIARVGARKSKQMVDYDHQWLHSKENGKPVPAAGWYEQLEWREGLGLFAVGVQWTAAAAEMISAGEYRYISPVIAYDKAGNVADIYMASLTNFPAIAGMEEVLLAAASAFFPSSNPSSEETMDELMEQLRWLLNLPVGAPADDIKAHMQKVMDQLGTTPDRTAAASFDLVGHLAAQKQSIADLSAKVEKPDPARFVPVAQLVDVQHQLAALSAEVETGKRAALLEQALADGRILPAHEAYWKEQPFAALSAFVALAKPIAPLGSMQSEGQNLGGERTAALSADAAKVCELLGVSPDDFRATQAAA
ncbi:MAG TPA: phage protease [Rhodocyclaceae bacterium]|nr:phage protease [Rhodocyclaceae bacterium]